MAFLAEHLWPILYENFCDMNSYIPLSMEGWFIVFPFFQIYLSLVNGNFSYVSPMYSPFIPFTQTIKFSLTQRFAGVDIISIS